MGRSCHFVLVNFSLFIYKAQRVTAASHDRPTVRCRVTNTTALVELMTFREEPAQAMAKSPHSQYSLHDRRQFCPGVHGGSSLLLLKNNVGFICGLYRVDFAGTLKRRQVCNMSSAKSRPHHGHPRTFVKREYFAPVLLISLFLFNMAPGAVNVGHYDLGGVQLVGNLINVTVGTKGSFDRFPSQCQAQSKCLAALVHPPSKKSPGSAANICLPPGSSQVLASKATWGGGHRQHTCHPTAETLFHEHHEAGLRGSRAQPDGWVYSAGKLRPEGPWLCLHTQMLASRTECEITHTSPVKKDGSGGRRKEGTYPEDPTLEHTQGTLLIGHSFNGPAEEGTGMAEPNDAAFSKTIKFASSCFERVLEPGFYRPDTLPQVFRGSAEIVCVTALWKA
ncbi:hypothetical protein ACRRTK_005331 [Alexandromys fortis]